MTGKPVQPSQQFVLAQGFRQMDGGFWALIGHDNSLRLFAELTANPDQPDVRPSEAYQVMLTSMQPGWTFRCLQIFWPDPDPRTLFQNQIEGRSEPTQEGQNMLHHGLHFFVQEFPLPFMRRTILEFAMPNKDALSWWQSLPGVFGTYGVQVVFLEMEGIQALSHWVFNPKL